ncbi:TetR/AcrR family transcriptional regulator [Actinoplanes sp. NPDC051851]|uniref:TetR/AcrR family transcriptional regulator n=1 Tax=Actinoplanes sp. NPDC051851 TaxID=3154753 RepID=UPI003442A0ED
MPTNSAPTRSPRSGNTRLLILTAAERLFAVHGIAAVSNRQICEAAGQANNSVIAYHFGTRDDLIRAIVAHHQSDIERRRDAMPPSTTPYDGVVRLVRPILDHYAALGRPSWYARFAAQVTTDPALRHLVIDEVMAQPSMRRALADLGRYTADLPPHALRQRADMSRLLIVHMCAEFEQSLADGTADTTWDQTAEVLVDALLDIMSHGVRDRSGS